MNEEKVIPIKVEVDDSDVTKSFKNIEKSANKIADNVNKTSKKATDGVVKNTQGANAKLTKQFKDLHKQVTKSFDVTEATNKMAKSMSQLKTQIESALGDVKFDVQLNANNTNTNGIASALAGATTGVATGGALKQTLTQAYKASQQLVDNTKKYNKHLKEAVAQNREFGELDKLSKIMADFHKNTDISDVMKKNNMTFREAYEAVNELIVMFTHLNGVMNSEDGVGRYAEQLEMLDEYASKLESMTKVTRINRGNNSKWDNPLPEGMTHNIQQVVAESVKLTNAWSRLRVKVEEIKQSAPSAWGKVKDSLQQIKVKNEEWLKSHTKTVEGIKKANKGLELSFKSVLKTIMPFISIGAIFTGLKTSINNAMESIETTSKFESIFGDEAKEMSKWINQLNKDLGVNTTSMMDYTSTLYGMGKNLGFTTQEAVKFSKDLGLLSQDMASFYNISSDDAFNKLRSYMAGSTEVLYDYGVVATEANLKTFALSKGITKAYNSMNQAEKSMLRYEFAMKGLEQANKDLEITLKSPSNQARMLKESLNGLSVALGSCFMPILTVVLPILNTFTQALTRTMNAVSTFISSLFGAFGVKVGGGISETADKVEGMVGAIEGADIGSGGLSDNLASGAESAKQIQKFLGGIDELNIVTTKQDKGSGGSGSGGGATGGITGGNIETGAIEKGLDEVKTKLQQWAETVGNTLKKGWNSVGDYINTSANKLKQSFAHLGKAIQSFLLGAWRNGGEQLIYNFGRLGGALTGLALDISGQVVDAVAKLFDHLNPDRNVNTRKFIKAMNNCLVACQNFALSAGKWLSTFMASGGQAFLNVMGDIVMLVGTTLVNAFANCINWITMFMNSWAGQTIIKVVAVSLDVLAGALKLVMVAVEKLTPLWSALLLHMGATKGFEVLQKALALTTQHFVDLALAIATSVESLVTDVAKLTKAVGTTLVNGLQVGIAKLKDFSTALKAHSFKDWVSIINGNVKSAINGFKDWLVTARLQATLFGATIKTKVISSFKTLKTTMATAVKNFATWVTSLNFATIATTATTIATNALNVALAILTSPITAIIIVIGALIAVVVAIGNKFNWWSNISEWLGEKIGWVWDKVKGFLGWSDDTTSESIEEVGNTFEETTNEIETTSDRFGTIASKINEHFASIGFDAGKLARDLEEAETMFNEKFGMMSAKAKEYLDALATGNEEVLTQMSADSDTYTQEILYSYQKLSDNEKNVFYETYGYIKGVNDDWLNYNNLSYEQLMAKHASYSANILSQEDLTAQEKDRLIDEHLAKVEGVYQQELETLKEQREKILSNTQLSENSRKQMLEDINNMIMKKEQEKTQDTIEGIESVTTAQQQASQAQTQAYEETADAQVKALEEVDSSLEKTKQGLTKFKQESDKVANSIPKAWNGIGGKISLEFSKAKKQVTTEMTSMAKLVVDRFNTMKTTIGNVFTQLATLIQNKMVGMNQVVVTQMATMRNTISNESNQFKNIFGQNLDAMSNKVNSKFNEMLNNIRSFVTQMKKAMNFNFPTPYLKMPHLYVTGNWDFEKKKVPQYSVRWFSQGGVFPSRTLIGVGDANKGVGNNAEAVLPLDVLWDKLDRKFANQNKQLISALNNTDQPIILQLNLDGEVLAKKQFKTYKDLTQRKVVDFTELV